jgi:hypothetical protein
MPATDAMTAAAMYPGAIFEDFSLPSNALAGVEGIEVTVWVTTEPLWVTTNTLVTGLPGEVGLGEESGAEVGETTGVLSGTNGVKNSSSVSVISVNIIEVFGFGDEVGEGEFRPAEFVEVLTALVDAPAVPAGFLLSAMYPKSPFACEPQRSVG